MKPTKLDIVRKLVNEYKADETGDISFVEHTSKSFESGFSFALDTFEETIQLNLTQLEQIKGKEEAVWACKHMLNQIDLWRGAK